jgi:hypothetical protein
VKVYSLLPMVMLSRLHMIYPQASGLRHIRSHLHTMQAEPEENAGALLGSLGTTYNCQPSSSPVPILLLGTKCVNPPIATTDMSRPLVTNALKTAWPQAGFVPGLQLFHRCMGQRIRPLGHGDHTSNLRLSFLKICYMVIYKRLTLKHVQSMYSG